MSDDLRITLLVLDFALWALAMVMAFSKHVRSHETRRRRY